MLSKFKKSSLVFLFTLILFGITDFIFSNFIYKKKINIRYDCYEYIDHNLNGEYFLDYKLVPLTIMIFAVCIYLFCIRLFLLQKIQLSIYFSFIVLSCFFIIFCGYFEEWKSYDRHRKRSQVTFYFDNKILENNLSVSNLKNCEFVHA